ncbi:UNVERIFIED_CONTAM: hypothetical protein GTU68_044582, partial [Idotea baltica]|nr:hypothetical protein [Idotea baltica]
LLEVLFFESKKIISTLQKITKKYPNSIGIVSNVASISEFKLSKLHKMMPLHQLSSSSKIPFKNLYETPKTLGVDRIALVAAAVNQFKNKNVLVIDAGTCITYDFVNKNKEYLGGAISPGVRIRYKSLQKFTENLPYLEKEEVSNYIGNSTEKSMHSGVVNGVLKELDGVILDYKQRFVDLTVVLTGGDTNFLSKQLKSSIFANQNFLLEGLNKILIFNNKK